MLVISALAAYVFVLNLSTHVAGKAWVPKKRVDPIIESVTLEPELEEALASASDAELCDIAGSVIPPRASPHSHMYYMHSLFLKQDFSLNRFLPIFCFVSSKRCSISYFKETWQAHSHTYTPRYKHKSI